MLPFPLSSPKIYHNPYKIIDSLLFIIKQIHKETRFSYSANYRVYLKNKNCTRQNQKILSTHTKITEFS